MYEILRPSKQITVVKVPIADIGKFDVLMGAGKYEVMSAAYSRLPSKPDFMMNGGFFDMTTGATYTNTIDEGKVLYNSQKTTRFGFYIKRDGTWGFGDMDLSYRDFLGASPTLIRDGKIQIERYLGASILNVRHPRSAFGMNKTHFFLVTIDGRRDWLSLFGMTTKEVAEYMLKTLGCTYAVGEDGGGSTRLMQKTDKGLIALNNPTENRVSDSFLCLYLKPAPVVMPSKDIRTVTASTLNIRAGAGTNYKVVGAYPKGVQVAVLETKDTWCRTKDGWVASWYLTKPAALDTREVTASVLNVRRGPGTTYGIVSTYGRGTKVTVLEVLGGWCRTNAGWVSNDYLKKL
jgi:uncharacterized protein YraI